ncbi:MAG: hypothetical protein ACREIU_01720, partial [Planctomycetota bacterium]
MKPHLEEGELLALLDGDSPEAAAHASSCESCAKRLSELRSFEGFLRAKVGASPASRPLPPGLERRYREAFDRAHALRPEKGRGPRRSFFPPSRWASLAAVLVAGLALYLLWPAPAPRIGSFALEADLPGQVRGAALRLRSGDRFRLSALLTREGHVVVFHRDTSRRMNLLFPFARPGAGTLEDWGLRGPFPPGRPI